MKKFWKLASLVILLLATVTVFVACKGSEKVAVDGVSLNASEKTLMVGDTYELVATVSPADAENKAVSWSSDAEATATVSDGLVTARSVGTATITVSTVDGSKTATCVITVISDGKSKERAIPLALGETNDAPIDAECDSYDGSYGRWYRFTPSSTGSFVIKSRDAELATTVYLFDSEEAESIADESHSEFNYFAFRLERELTAGKTYYFFVALQDNDSGAVTFEFFASLDVPELIAALDSAKGDLFLSYAIELLDMIDAYESDAEDVLADIKADEIVTVAEKGSFDGVYALLQLDYYNNKNAHPALAKLNPGAFFTLAVGGSEDARDILITLTEYGNSAAQDALDLLELGSTVALVEGGDEESFELLIKLATHGSKTAITALSELDVSKWVDFVADGSESAASKILTLARYGNEEAQNALQTTDMTAWVELAEAGDSEAAAFLKNMAEYGFITAREALRTLDITELLLLAEGGSQETIKILWNIRYYCENVISGFGAMDVEAWVELAESDIFSATQWLSDLAFSGNEAARSALQTLDFAPAMELSTFQKYNVLIFLAEYGNQDTFDELVRLADGNTSAPLQSLAILVEKRSVFADAALEKLVEYTERADYYAYYYLYSLLDTVPEIAQEAIKNLDISGFETKFNNAYAAKKLYTASNIIDSLCDFAMCGNTAAQNFLLNIDWTPFMEGLEYDIGDRVHSSSVYALMNLATVGDVDAQAALRDYNAVPFMEKYGTYIYEIYDEILELGRYSNGTVFPYLTERAESGDFYAVSALGKIAELGVKAAADALKELDTAGLVWNMQKVVSYYWTNYVRCLKALMLLADYENSAAISALKAQNLSKMLHSADYDEELVELFSRLKGYGHPGAVEMMKNMPIAQLVARAECGLNSPLSALAVLAREENPNAIAAVQALDLSVLAAKNENDPEAILDILKQIAELGNKDAVYILVDFSDDGVTAASAVLKTLNVFVFVMNRLDEQKITDFLVMLVSYDNKDALTALGELAEDGSDIALDALTKLSYYYGNTDAPAILAGMSPAIYLERAAAVDSDAGIALVLLVGWDNEAAIDALSKFDASNWWPVAANGSSGVMYFILALADCGNTAVLERIKTYEPADSMIEWIYDGYDFMLRIFTDLYEYECAEVMTFLDAFDINDTASALSFTSIIALAEIDNASAKAFLASNDVSELIARAAESGDSSALNSLIYYAEYGNEQAIDFLKNTKLDKFIAKLANEPCRVVNMLGYPAFYGNEEAVALLVGFDITPIVASAEAGDESAERALNTLALYGNIAAQEYLDSL